MSRAALQTFKSRPNWHNTMQAIHGFLKGLVKPNPDKPESRK
jgi:hypothetical protein